MNATILNQHFNYDAASGHLVKKAGVKAGRIVGWQDRQGYVKVRFLGKTHLAHRLIVLMVTGELPAAVDHINGDRADNRLSNLRPATFAQNNRNAKLRTDSTSGVTGVSWRASISKWRAHISIGGRSRALGSFVTLEDAVAARKAAEAALGFHPNHGRIG